MGLDQIKVELQEWMGSDRAIAEAAWTSSYSLKTKDKKSDEDVERIVTMMAQSGHGTPFEAVVMRFWLRIPIFTDRQHMTHRVATHNGLSGRYRTMPSDWYVPPSDVRHIINKAGIQGLSPLTAYDEAMTTAYRAYNTTLEALREAEIAGLIDNKEYKRAREVFRGMLPVGGMTERISVFNLRSFANYIRHRLSPHAQREIRYAAFHMLKAVKEANIAPVAIRELEKNKWVIEPDMPDVVKV